jgi:ketosteroid isomerase-like protein
MSDRDVAVVRANSEAFSRRDVDTMLTMYAPDAAVVDRRRVSLGTFRGHDDLRVYYESIFHTAAEMREEMTILAARDGLVVTHCDVIGRLANAPAGSPEITVPYGLVVRVEDGKIAHLDLYESGDDALAAFNEGQGGGSV